jgi:hypothetical protein
MGSLSPTAPSAPPGGPGSVRAVTVARGSDVTAHTEVGPPPEGEVFETVECVAEIILSGFALKVGRTVPGESCWRAALEVPRVKCQVPREFAHERAVAFEIWSIGVWSFL